MNITLYGAANEVTGSCYLVQATSTRLLIDCGLFQGSPRLEKHNRIPTTIISPSVDMVLLTHGHLDHCGRLPLLIKKGYQGPIYATAGTIDIAKLILSDAADIQEHDTERENRRREHFGLDRLEPLFTSKDVERVSALFHSVEYGEPLNLAEGISANFVDAGHILGSSSIELKIDTGGIQRKIIFSGDLGQYDVPIMRNPSHLEGADLVFIESTYGDRDHRSMSSTVDEFREIVKSAVARRGKVLIPTFAVGRAQSILYCLAEMFRNKIIEPIPIYLDSPMAIAATTAYLKHTEFMDEEVKALAESGQLRRDLATLVACESAEQSQTLNAISGPCIILAGAGMCNAGRIIHHLKHNLGSPDCHVVIVGYQAQGSLGRLLVEGAPKVKIFGETVIVRAQVKALGGFSAHAGQSDLLRWLSPLAKTYPRIVLTHGENHPIKALSHQIKTRFGVTAEIPKLWESLSI